MSSAMEKKSFAAKKGICGKYGFKQPVSSRNTSGNCCIGLSIGSAKDQRRKIKLRIGNTYKIIKSQ
jgi:hypothetical protein